MSDIPDLGYSPLVGDFALRPHHAGMGEFLNENVARIEALKIRLFSLPGLAEFEKVSIFRELDLLRGAFVEAANFHQHVLTAPAERAPAAPLDRRPGDLILPDGIIGGSAAIADILKIIAKVAPTDLTVLLEGETGTGKELVSRIIHVNSQRQKFVAVNCGAFPSGIIESELFGHVKGAYTGATTDRKGKFEEADGGTIFLDEIGDLELSAQVKLLRVVELGELQRVGSDKPCRIDVRIICATNRNLEEMVLEGSFREDLFYRINMCTLRIPPLRERRDEVEILLEFFLQEFSKTNHVPRLDAELRDFICQQYPFPGNIRELKNLAFYIASIAGAEAVTLADLPERYKRREIREMGLSMEEAPPRMNEVRQEAEKDYLVRLLTKHKGNVQGLCVEMGLSRSRVYQLLGKYALHPARFR